MNRVQANLLMFPLPGKTCKEFLFIYLLDPCGTGLEQLQVREGNICVGGWREHKEWESREFGCEGQHVDGPLRNHETPR